MIKNISSIEKSIKILTRLSKEPHEMTALELSDEDSIKGLIGVGAPVKNSKGSVVASVATAILKGTIADDEFKEIINKTISSANKISQLLV